MHLKIDHIGIAVRSLKDAIRIYSAGLDFKVAIIEEVADQSTRVAMLPIGESRLELLEPSGDDSPVAKFITKRGEGMHHICVSVENITQAIGQLKAAGARMIDETPRPGANGCLVAFVHPSSTCGVLIELAQAGGNH